MKPIAHSKVRRNALLTFRAFKLGRGIAIPSFSTEASSKPPCLQASLYQELTSRPVKRTTDRITLSPWHLLNTTLADFLPPSCYPTGFDASNPDAAYDVPPDPDVNDFLPQGHHLVYFPPAVVESGLLPDGTDSLHSPGPPFVRRLWAGGSIIFNCRERYQLRMRNTLAVCSENITDVKVQGAEGDEKVFVSIRRRIRSIPPRSPPEKELLLQSNEKAMLNPVGGDIGNLAVSETRHLVFLREKSREQAKKDLEKVGKVIKPKTTPDFSVYITPTRALLFRFSALTFNAHRIHFDPQYTREVEGHRNLLVHGPLTLVLMLSVMRSQLKEGEMIARFDYRNLAPLYVQEEMRICVRRDPEHRAKLDVWVEGRDGGYAVKGVAELRKTVSFWSSKYLKLDWRPDPDPASDK
ncbi:uncharacterized protein L3040_003913 [Drepanopeziza brunnea f. sp. 'multigermtubi']|uniref:uncharacterized protein n=1 Tax=Drepanopeziza brunnea f. sp. 'multigermtubi' TaxID=698441 RepID=UPI002384CEA0|nr:hypothetical protein L3040_003913 [Drepanopeziza brunnea f. sp. 'multigermtubi']